MDDSSQKKNAQTLNDSFESNFIGSKRKPILTAVDRAEVFFNNILQKFLNNNNIKHYSRNSSLSTLLRNNFTLPLKIFLRDQFLKEAKAIA